MRPRRAAPLIARPINASVRRHYASSPFSDGLAFDHRDRCGVLNHLCDRHGRECTRNRTLTQLAPGGRPRPCSGSRGSILWVNSCAGRQITRRQYRPPKTANIDLRCAWCGCCTSGSIVATVVGQCKWASCWFSCRWSTRLVRVGVGTIRRFLVSMKTPKYAFERTANRRRNHRRHHAAAQRRR